MSNAFQVNYWILTTFASFCIPGVALFSLAMKSPKEESETQLHGLVFLLLYISFDSFTSQWQDKVYTQYGRANVDPYQMMLGINSSAIVFTTAGLIFSGDFPVVWEFLLVNPIVLKYNIITAITSASGQLFIFYTIREFGPVVFTLIMIIRQMLSICISAVTFHHKITVKALFGMTMVFGVLFFQARRKYYAKMNKQPPALTTIIPGKWVWLGCIIIGDYLCSSGVFRWFRDATTSCNDMDTLSQLQMIAARLHTKA